MQKGNKSETQGSGRHKCLGMVVLLQPGHMSLRRWQLSWMLNNKKEPAMAGLRKAQEGDEGISRAGSELSLVRGSKEASKVGMWWAVGRAGEAGAVTQGLHHAGDGSRRYSEFTLNAWGIQRALSRRVIWSKFFSWIQIIYITLLVQDLVQSSYLIVYHFSAAPLIITDFQKVGGPWVSSC